MFVALSGREPFGSSRRSEINTFRGLAVIMVVAFHVIGGTVTSGLRVADDSIWRLFADVFVYTRMPLFIFISGYIYASRPVTFGQIDAFLGGKARRFLLPFLTVTTLHQVLAHMIGSNFAVHPEHLLTIFVYGYAHLWYLQATLLIFLAVVVLETSGVTRHRVGLAIAVLLSLAFSQLEFVQSIRLFSLFKAAYLLPFFLAGLYMRRFDILLTRIQMITGAGVLGVGFVLLLLRETGVYDAGLPVETESAVMMMFSALVCVVLVSSKLNIPWVAALGRYSYPIYLLHFLHSGFREGLMALGVGTVPALFVLCTGFSLFAPILMAQWIERIPAFAR